jgi:hypothetical protein
MAKEFGFAVPFHISSLPLLISRSLFVLLYASRRESSPAKILRLTIKRRAWSRRRCATSPITFRTPWAVNIKSLNGELVPLGKNEFPLFDDKDSFNLQHKHSGDLH